MKKLIFIVPTVFLFGSIIDGLPYGYFQILRIVVFIASIFVALMANETTHNWGIWVFGFIALLFNPIRPIYLSRSIWLLMDIISGITFIAFGLLIHSFNKEESKHKK